jgi:cytochrome c
MRLTSFIFLLFGAAAFVCTGIVSVLAENTGLGAPVNGKRVYLADGYFLCHGRAGQGSAMNYPAPAIAS